MGGIKKRKASRKTINSYGVLDPSSSHPSASPKSTVSSPDLKREFTLSNIAKLEGQKNYKTWRSATMAYFTFKRLDKHLKEDTSLKEEGRNALCINLLCKVIASKLHDRLHAFSSTFKAWKYLEEKFLGDALHQVLSSLTVLGNIKNVSIDDFTDRFVCHATKVQNLERSFTDKQIILMYLAYLPAQAEQFIPRVRDQVLEGSLQNAVDVIRRAIPRKMYYQSKQGQGLNKLRKNKTSDKEKGKKGSHVSKRGTQRSQGHAKQATDSKALSPDSETDNAASTSTWAAGAIAAVSLTTQAYLLDSGASHHYCGSKEHFTKLVPLPQPMQIKTASGTEKVSYSGDVWIQLSKTDVFHLKEVLLLPSGNNLISISRLCKSGFTVNMTEDHLSLLRPDGSLMIQLRPTDNVYAVHPVILRNGPTAMLAANSVSVSDIWHYRLGHMSEKVCAKLKKTHILPERVSSTRQFCSGCCEGKLSRAPIPSVATSRRGKATKALCRLHVDLVGPFRIQSNWCKYFVLVTDEYTAHKWILGCRSKDRVAGQLQVLLTDLINRNLGHIQTKVFRKFLKDHGVTLELSVPYTPEQNGQAERQNRTVMEMTRCLLHAAQLRTSFWYWAALHAVYILNRIPNISRGFIPYQELYQRVPCFDHLKIFGAVGMAQFPGEVKKGPKLAAKAIKAIHLGFDTEHRAYVMWIPEWNCYKITRTVVLDEKALIQASKERFSSSFLTKEYQDLFLPDQDLDPVPTRVAALALTLAEQQSPRSFKQIMAMPIQLKTEWLQAYQKEIGSLESVGGLHVVPRSEAGDSQVIPLSEVFTQKYNNVLHKWIFKVRLCCRGDLVKENEGTFAPVITPDGLRIALSLSVRHKWKYLQADVSTAFLNARDTKTRFYNLPQGHRLKDGKLKIWAGECALYGLRQAPRLWNACIDGFLQTLGFRKLLTDPCLYRMDKRKDTLLILYVDDLLLTSNDDELIAKFKENLESRFKIRSTSAVTEFLGMELSHSNNGLFMCHKKKILSLAATIEVDQSETRQTLPMNENADLNVKAKPFHPVTLFQSLLGSLNYITGNTRPDCAVAVNLLSRFQASPTIAHYRLAKKIAKYLFQTADLGIKFDRQDAGTANRLKIYTDSNFVRTGDGHSTAGYCIFFNNHLLKYKSKKIKRATNSTCLAETLALLLACTDAKGILLIFEELGVPIQEVRFLCDNKAVVDIMKTTKVTEAVKQLTLPEIVARQDFLLNNFEIEYISTLENTADLFTKNLGQKLFQKHKSALISASSE